MFFFKVAPLVFDLGWFIMPTYTGMARLSWYTDGICTLCKWSTTSILTQLDTELLCWAKRDSMCATGQPNRY